MHIGFSFKPKTLLIVLAVILGIVAYGVRSEERRVGKECRL